jgi:hypothetical protein
VRLIRVVAVAAALPAGADALRAEPSIAILPLAFSVSEFRAPSSRVAALIGTTAALR